MGGGKRRSLLQILSPPQYIVPLPSIACFPSVLFCAYLGLRSRSVNKLTEQRNWRTGLGGCTTKKRQRQLRLFGLRCHCSEIRLSTTATLKSGRMLQRGEADDHSRTRRTTD